MNSKNLQTTDAKDKSYITFETVSYKPIYFEHTMK